MDPIVEYCLSRRAAVLEYPFGPDTMVFKVGGKMFALMPGDGSSVSLKCDPAIAENLREQHEAITPGYHLNKKHWNTVHMDGSLTIEEVQDMIDHSYKLVFKGLPKSERSRIEDAILP
ncbi:putative DNA-binding protein (MmcQ/YjbR family) [Paenibacillus phyllosphaerae]|uniref:Putative DNA-binding protein (MmcQ/YjbR family) n=1 Tax=Paenibacillus phyllosphaerae TaxID=274593 RepID=A0A7W5B0B1_9BACL|nr:MmcQ/YjbR family DNA-binding protein [Paenibacillus phyllosphaerae]MBB3112055.1 putative DNA-binding protein (MmcQ/YjbR family) [Paenibacillus phyllosphaerae]